MQKFSQILKVLGIIGVVIAVGIGIGWVASRSGPTKVPPGTDTVSTDAHSPTANPVRPEHRTAGTRVADPLVPHANAIEITATGPANLITNWEDKLEEIITSEDDDTNKVKQLLTMFRQLPPDGQEEVAQHLSNLVEDEDYAPLGEMAADPKLPEELLDTLMADLLNRPNAAKLPLFLEIARTPDHPKAEEARDLMELYLDEDYGNDWPTWQKKMQEWLKANPD